MSARVAHARTKAPVITLSTAIPALAAVDTLAITVRLVCLKVVTTNVRCQICACKCEGCSIV